MSRVLIVHNGVSHRFGFLSAALQARGDQVALINAPDGADLPGAIVKKWKAFRNPGKDTYDVAARAERDALRGRCAAVSAAELKEEGFIPDLIVGHPGWGEMLFLGEVFPGVPQIQVAEFYYKAFGADMNFDPEFPTPGLEHQIRAHALNMPMALSYAEADWIVAPTPFQASLIPRGLRARVKIIHEGVDTAAAFPRDNVVLTLKNGRKLTKDRPVVTFINRRFEPMRGFHVFMRAMPELHRLMPEADVIIIGADDPNVYGKRPDGGKQTWKQVMLAELGDRLPQDRVHFVGAVDYKNLIGILSISSAHVYFTYPFVLSWSLLDAMSTECLIVGSDTAPVRDVIRHGENGLLTPFFDTNALATVLAEACRHPNRFHKLRKAARATAIAEYDRATICEPDWMKLVDQTLAEGRG